MLIPNHCKTCLSFHAYLYVGLSRECKYTEAGVTHLKNCPCADCLIKTMCTDSCRLIADHIDIKSNLSVYNTYCAGIK
jgi:hypothetical protein